jgi:hypothetical protein
MVVKEIYGKFVDIDIPADVFPTTQEIAAIDELLPGCHHGWYKSVTLHEINKEPIDLHYRYWLPEGSPKGILIYTHGIHSHSGHASRLNGRPLDVVSKTRSVCVLFMNNSRNDAIFLSHAHTHNSIYNRL